MALSREARDRMIRQEMRCVHPVALSVYWRTGGWVPIEELEAVGRFCLVESVQRFNPKLGVPFGAYVRSRMPGRMLDFVRSEGWVPTKTFRRHNLLLRTRERLTQRLGRDPSSPELAGELDMTLEQFRVFEVAAVIERVTSLDGPIPNGDETLYDRLADTRVVHADTLLEELSRRQLAQDLIDALPSRHRQAVRLYASGLTLKEVGERLGVSESRACQIVKGALRRTRHRFMRWAG